MNRKFALLTILIALVFSACSGTKKTKTEIWEDGYDAGYSDGKFESDMEHEDDYADGYEEGYQDASSDYDLHHPRGISQNLLAIFVEIEEEAISYAGRDSDHDIMSALDTVDAYLNNTTTILGEWPSKSDFEAAVRYLFDYSDFYYNRKYAN
jgi:hypothetical protein